MNAAPCWVPLVHFLKVTPAVSQTPKDDLSADQHLDEHVRCAACLHPVTSVSDRRHLDGAFDHRFTNPAGVPYHIGCYAAAAGCSLTGAPTTEHTWFPGYSWLYAICAGCAIHLGWQFRDDVSDGDRFYGLILDRLTQG
jgi:hypothetical protein